MFGSAGARVLPCIINIEAKQQVDLYTDQHTFHHTQRNMGTFWQALKELEYCIKVLDGNTEMQIKLKNVHNLNANLKWINFFIW